MKRLLMLGALLLVEVAVPLFAEGLDSLRYYSSPSSYSYDVPAVQDTTYLTRKYPMGGSHGVPTIIQMQATSADTAADSINVLTQIELSIDSLSWFVDSLSVDTLTTETAVYKVIAPSKAWNWYRGYTEGLAASDSSGDVTVKFKISRDYNRVKW